MIFPPGSGPQSTLYYLVEPNVLLELCIYCTSVFLRAVSLALSRAHGIGLNDEWSSKGAWGFWGRDVGFEVIGSLGIPRYTLMYRLLLQESDLKSTNDLQQALALFERKVPFALTDIC